MDKYVKRKKLDPLASYIPAILVAQSQLQDVPAAADAIGLEAARALLREGAFVGLRDNVRAVGEYAADTIGKDNAQAQMLNFFRAVEKVDTVLFLEMRSKEPEVPEELDDLVDAANFALEKILLVVPEEDVDKGREMVEVLRRASSVLYNSSESGSPAPEAVDTATAKRLEGLL